MAKITILTGSMRKGGNTDLLARAFFDGAAKNNDTEIISVSDYKVNPCIGCNACRKSAGNICFQKDDMIKIYDRLSKTDILIIASPVYFYGLSSQLKAIVDRLHSPQRKNFKIKKLGLLLVAADTIHTVFDSVKMQYKSVLDYFGLESIGEICVSGVEAKGAIAGNKALKDAFVLGNSISDEEKDSSKI